LKLRIHRLAVVEIDREVDYYESCRAGLGAQLEDEIDAVLETILQFPHAAPQWKDRRDRRVAVLDRFPFTLVYQFKAEEIVILALAHTSRVQAIGRTGADARALVDGSGCSPSQPNIQGARIAAHSSFASSGKRRCPSSAPSPDWLCITVTG
jgi:hypothetical protein